MRNLIPDDFRTLSILNKRSCHDVEGNPLHQLSRLIHMGFAMVNGNEYKTWGGKRYRVREVCIADAGRAALNDEVGK